MREWKRYSICLVNKFLIQFNLKDSENTHKKKMKKKSVHDVICFGPVMELAFEILIMDFQRRV